MDPLKGRIVTNSTSITLVNNTAKTQDITVPANKRWLLLFMSITNPDDVIRNVSVRLYLEAAKTTELAKIGAKSNMEASAAQRYNIGSDFPTGLSSNSIGIYPLLLASGMTIETVWAAGGVSAGGTDADGLVCYVVEYDL